MAVIANITAWNVTENGETLQTSNSGWTTSSTSPFGTNNLRVTNVQSPVSVYNVGTAHSLAYLRAAASANQTVRMTIRRETVVNGTFWHVLARVSSNNWIAAVFSPLDGGVTGRIKLTKCIGGTRTDVIISDNSSRLPSSETQGVLELLVTGTAPNIQASVKWDGVEVIAPQTLTETALNGPGSVGLQQRTFDSETASTGHHVVAFYAEDDSGGGGDTTPPTLTSPTGTSTGTTTASGSVSTNEANGTLYYLASTNASESAATVKAASSQAVSATGTQSVSFTGLTAATTYYAHYVHRDAAGNDSAVASSASFTTSAANTAPEFDGPNIADISGTEAVVLSSLDVSGRFSDAESALTFSAVGSWPAGVTVSSAGVISGTPTTAGTYSGLQVRATDAGALTADSNTFTITVAEAALPTVTSDEIKNNTGTLLASTTIPKVWLIPLGTPDYTNLVTNGAGELVISEAGLSGDYLIVTANADGTVAGVSKVTAT